MNQLAILKEELASGYRTDMTYDMLLEVASIESQDTINLSFVFDEGTISLLLGLTLLDGAEGSEEEDFLPTAGDAGFAPAIVAPLFLSNLGKHASESGPLFVKICTIFAFVLFSNLLGMLPYSDTGTSSLILTL